jgi:hypothetical protein
MIEYLKDCAKGWGFDGPGWYFWDEREAYCYGPYDSKEYAKIKFDEYCKRISNGNSDSKNVDSQS